MTILQIAGALLRVSIFMLVFSIGLQTSMADAIYLVRRPRLFMRSFIAMNVLMPVFAVIMALAFSLTPAVKIALVFLAVSPVPPILPMQEKNSREGAAYIRGLLITMALLCIIVMPLTIEVIKLFFPQQQVSVAPIVVAKIVLATVILPICSGMVLHRILPEVARRITRPLTMLAYLFLLAPVVVILIVAFPGIRAIVGNGTIAAIAAFVVFGIAAGYGMGGPSAETRSTLGLATASRHPGLAFAVASANFPAQRKAVAATILLYLLIRVLLQIPYNLWRKRRASAPAFRDKTAQGAA